MRTGERKEVNIVEKRLLFIPQSALRQQCPLVHYPRSEPEI